MYNAPVIMISKPIVLVTGASGYVGTALCSQLELEGYQIRRLTTQATKADQESTFYWNPETYAMDVVALQNVSYIIHLAGENIGAGRWTSKRRQRILDSRVHSTACLFEHVKRMQIPLKAFVAASAIGYYGNNTADTIIDEYSPSGNDFLADVCVQWERETQRFQQLNIRTVIVRTSLVFSRHAPILRKMLLPIRVGLGGPLGTGNQTVPWISLHDLCNIYQMAMEKNEITGAINAVAPQIISNKEMLKTFAMILRKPFFMPPVPVWLLRIVLGSMSILLTEGNPVVSVKLKELGYKWQYREIERIFE